MSKHFFMLPSVYSGLKLIVHEICETEGTVVYSEINNDVLSGFRKEAQLEMNAQQARFGDHVMPLQLLQLVNETINS